MFLAAILDALYTRFPVTTFALRCACDLPRGGSPWRLLDGCAAATVPCGCPFCSYRAAAHVDLRYCGLYAYLTLRPLLVVQRRGCRLRSAPNSRGRLTFSLHGSWTDYLTRSYRLQQPGVRPDFTFPFSLFLGLALYRLWTRSAATYRHEPFGSAFAFVGPATPLYWFWCRSGVPGNLPDSDCWTGHTTVAPLRLPHTFRSSCSTHYRFIPVGSGPCLTPHTYNDAAHNGGHHTPFKFFLHRYAAVAGTLQPPRSCYSSDG